MMVDDVSEKKNYIEGHRARLWAHYWLSGKATL